MTEEITQDPATSVETSSPDTSKANSWSGTHSFALTMEPLRFGQDQFLPGDDFVSETQEGWRLTPFEIASNYVQNRYNHAPETAEDITRMVLLLYLGQLKEKGWTLERRVHSHDHL